MPFKIKMHLQVIKNDNDNTWFASVYVGVIRIFFGISGF